MSPDFDAKRKEALGILAGTKIRKSSYEPPMFQLLWRLGVPVRPPHFYNPLAIGYALGLIFGLTVSLGGWVQVALSGSKALGLALGTLFFATLFSGNCFAAYYAFSRGDYNFPDWSSLKGLYPLTTHSSGRSSANAASRR